MSLAFMQVATPVGQLQWVRITGEGADNYNRDGKEFKATARYLTDSPECQKLIKTITEFFEEHQQKGLKLRSLGYVPEKDKDTGKETGYTLFRFKTKTEFEQKDGTMKKVVVKTYNAGNAAKRQRPAEIFLGNKQISNESKGSISGIAKMYINGRETGVSLFLNAIQLVKFVEYDNDPGFAMSDDADAYQGDDSGFDSTGFGTTAEEQAEGSATQEEPVVNEAPKPRL